MIRRPPRSTQSRSSAASDVYKRQIDHCLIDVHPHDFQARCRPGEGQIQPPRPAPNVQHPPLRPGGSQLSRHHIVEGAHYGPGHSVVHTSAGHPRGAQTDRPPLQETTFPLSVEQNATNRRQGEEPPSGTHGQSPAINPPARGSSPTTNVGNPTPPKPPRSAIHPPRPPTPEPRRGSAHSPESPLHAETYLQERSPAEARRNVREPLH